MAMEDAVCLSHMVEAFPGDFERAFEAYRARRIHRTTRMQVQSRAMGEHVYHPAGAHAELRNAMLRAKTQEEWLDTLQWLYGSTGLDEKNFA
jgi:3-hydroxybenzoate 6-monooxygenase